MSLSPKHHHGICSVPSHLMESVSPVTPRGNDELPGNTGFPSPLPHTVTLLRPQVSSSYIHLDHPIRHLKVNLEILCLQLHSIVQPCRELTQRHHQTCSITNTILHHLNTSSINLMMEYRPPPMARSPCRTYDRQGEDGEYTHCTKPPSGSSSFTTTLNIGSYRIGLEGEAVRS